MKSLYVLLSVTMVLAASTAVVVTPTTMVFGQQPQQPPQSQGTPDSVYDFNGQASPEKKAMFIEYAISQIRNMTDPSISISEDGSLSITSSSYDENGNYKIQSVMVRHPWTPSNGYNIDNGVMVAPNGTQVFP